MRGAFLAALCGILAGGCSTPGFLYTNVTLPLTVDMNATPRASDAVEGSQRTIREPFTRAGIRAEWAGYAPGATAQRRGLEVVHYADIRQESIFGGIWGRTTAVVHGRNLDGLAVPVGDGAATGNGACTPGAGC